MVGGSVSVTSVSLLCMALTLRAGSEVKSGRKRCWAWEGRSEEKVRNVMCQEIPVHGIFVYSVHVGVRHE